MKEKSWLYFARNRLSWQTIMPARLPSPTLSETGFDISESLFQAEQKNGSKYDSKNRDIKAIVSENAGFS